MLCFSREIMKIILLFAMFFSVYAQASQPIEATELTDEMAKELGFDVNKTKDKFGLTIELKGPSSFGSSCKPLAVGHFVIENEEEVSAFIGSAHPEIPQNMSFLAEKDGMRLVVFIDYQCDNTAKRFTVSSND
tara:strand:+ start:2584 stop:2982 length:399 start_codon:yes stop_codon:yes gene_type:complete